MGIFIRDNDKWTEINDFSRYVGGQWQSAQLSRYNGSQWELLWPMHFPYTVQYSLSGYVTYAQKGLDLVTYNYLSVGSTGGYFGVYYDTLMFFPLEQMRQDIGGALSITDASLTLHRRTNDQGEDRAYITLGSALSGMTAEAPASSWKVEFDELLSETVLFNRDQTKTFSFDPQGIWDMISGAADCLCLPTTGDNASEGYSYADFYPEEAVLTVSYIK